MNAIDLLKQDHERVKKLLAEGEDTTERAEKTRTKIFDQIKQEMGVHEVIEEEIFYPALKQHAEAKEIVLEGYEEHHVVDQILGELDDVPEDDERWGAKFSVMKENIEHHIEEEEEEMFEKAEDLLGEERLEELGAQMEQKKKELQA